MTNNPIDAALAAAESEFEIDLMNKVTGATYPKAIVRGGNTMEQILKEYAADIGVNPSDSKVIFENKRTGRSTNALDETVAGLGLEEGDILAISDNATVASDGDTFEIDLMNKATGATYPKAIVRGGNTMEQILKEYAADIGVNPSDSKVIFENKRTGRSTNALDETVAGLGLEEGDILVISDNATVGSYCRF